MLGVVDKLLVNPNVPDKDPIFQVFQQFAVNKLANNKLETTSSCVDRNTADKDAKPAAKQIGSSESAGERETSIVVAKPPAKPRKKRNRTRLTVMERRNKHFKNTDNSHDAGNDDRKSGTTNCVKYDVPYKKDNFPPGLPEYDTDKDGHDCGCMVQVIGLSRKITDEGALGERQSASDYFRICYTTSPFDLKVDHRTYSRMYFIWTSFHRR